MELWLCVLTSEKSCHPFYLCARAGFAASLAPRGTFKREKRVNTMHFTGALPVSNRKHAFLRRNMQERGKRLIDREERRQLFSGRVGMGGRGRGREAMKGWLAGQSVKEGRQNPGFSPERKKRRGFEQMMD